MQFNSYLFILLFLPVTVIAYFLTSRFHVFVGKVILILASLLFYAYSDWKTLIVLGISIVVNFVFAKLMEKQPKWHGIFLFVPIAVNVGLLLYFKYLNFAITNLNSIFGTQFVLKELMLPIGISFFTFQQIAYVVGVYKKEIERAGFVDYLAYITYFPKILMGPLADPVDFIQQLNDTNRKKLNWDNIATGVQIFCFGLFKKVMTADTFAAAVSWGYNNVNLATSIDWLLVLYALKDFLIKRLGSLLEHIT